MGVAIEICLDSNDGASAAAFWAAALNYRIKGAAGQYHVLVDPDGTGPRVVIQQVDEAKQGKNRVHFDLYCPDMDAEADRVEALGARRVQRYEEFGTAWILFNDPDGNEFCVCRAHAD